MRVSKNPITRIKIWCAKELFKIYFGEFFYPFEDADADYENMDGYKKIKYLKSIRDWVESPGFKTETQGLIRMMYRDMALKSQDEVHVTAYRLALMMLRDQQKRLLALADKYRNIKEVS